MCTRVSNKPKVTLADLIQAAICKLQEKNGVTACEIGEFIAKKRCCSVEQLLPYIKSILCNAVVEGILCEKNDCYRIAKQYDDPQPSCDREEEVSICDEESVDESCDFSDDDHNRKLGVDPCRCLNLSRECLSEEEEYRCGQCPPKCPKKKKCKINTSKLILLAINDVCKNDGISIREVVGKICQNGKLKENDVKKDVKRFFDKAVQKGLLTKTNGLYKIRKGSSNNNKNNNNENNNFIEMSAKNPAEDANFTTLNCRTSRLSFPDDDGQVIYYRPKSCLYEDDEDEDDDDFFSDDDEDVDYFSDDSLRKDSITTIKKSHKRKMASTETVHQYKFSKKDYGSHSDTHCNRKQTRTLPDVDYEKHRKGACDDPRKTNDPSQQDDDPCKKKDPCQKEDPCKKKEICQKEDPCKKKEPSLKEDPSKKKEICQKEEACKKKDPCLKEDPCKKNNSNQKKSMHKKKVGSQRKKDSGQRDDSCKKYNSNQKKSVQKKKVGSQRKKDSGQRDDQYKKRDSGQRNDPCQKDDPCKKRDSYRKSTQRRKKDSREQEYPKEKNFTSAELRGKNGNDECNNDNGNDDSNNDNGYYECINSGMGIDNNNRSDESDNGDNGTVNGRGSNNNDDDNNCPPNCEDMYFMNELTQDECQLEYIDDGNYEPMEEDGYISQDQDSNPNVLEDENDDMKNCEITGYDLLDSEPDDDEEFLELEKQDDDNYFIDTSDCDQGVNNLEKVSVCQKGEQITEVKRKKQDKYSVDTVKEQGYQKIGNDEYLTADNPDNKDISTKIINKSKMNDCPKTTTIHQNQIQNENAEGNKNQTANVATLETNCSKINAGLKNKESIRSDNIIQNIKKSDKNMITPCKNCDEFSDKKKKDGNKLNDKSSVKNDKKTVEKGFDGDGKRDGKKNKIPQVTKARYQLYANVEGGDNFQYGSPKKKKNEISKSNRNCNNNNNNNSTGRRNIKELEKIYNEKICFWSVI
ncbi:RNA polymerase-associated protein LEO1, putative [Pediculus humanus corporis]|uniref:RNA polymerase-associated protein LEO1, putative n=1 Tax=Pediculus humanus subsp. corporis TaxID=121224 RepID=E0VWI5_PEDHC|nr:RNA polymerase-associated protein LEO1, putative [Pediculus humanus corporis]EEB17741.1 RNA polymerase-associated protein LEO1, putative [Pediculus humanus corporis]